MKYNTTIGSNKVFDVTYSRFRADDAFGSRPEVSPGDIATNDTTTQISAVALPTYRAIGMFRDQVRTTLSWFQGQARHQGRLRIRERHPHSRFWSTSGLRSNFANGVPTSVNTYLVQVTQSDTTYGADIDELFRYRADEHGLFIQDRWTPMRKLVLNLGLRYETSSSYQPATCRPVTQFAPEPCYDKVTAPSFRDLSPRFNMVYDLTGDGRTALKFAANRYNQPINISMIERLNPVAVGNNVTSDQRSWNDANGDLIPQSNEIGPSPGYVFVGANGRYADDLKRPVSNEYTVEIQRELPQNMVLSAGYTHRQTAPEHRRDRHGPDARVMGRADYRHRSHQRRGRPGLAPRHRQTALDCSTTPPRWTGLPRRRHHAEQAPQQQMGAAGGRLLGQGHVTDARRPSQRSAHPQLLRRRDAGRHRSPVVVPPVRLLSSCRGT